MPNHNEDMKEQALKAFAGWAPKEFLTRQVMDLAIGKAIETEKAEWRKQSMSKKTVEEIREEIERRLEDIGMIPLYCHDVMQDAEQTVLEQLLYFIDGKEEK